MDDILLDTQYDLQVSNSGDLVIGNSDYQRSGLIIITQKGEFKETPTIGLGIDNYLRKSVTAHSKQMFITELKSELSSDGIKAYVRIATNDISKLEIDI